MAKKTYCGVNNKALRIPDKGYGGVNNRAYKLIKGYCGDENGKAQQFWPGIVYDGFIFFKGSIFQHTGRWNIFCTPALSRKEYSNDMINSQLPNSSRLTDMNGLLMAYLIADTQNVFWTNGGYPYLRWESYVTNHWQVDENNYIYIIEPYTDFRTDNYFYFPVNRIYIDVQSSSSVKYFDIEVSLKGKSNIIGHQAQVLLNVCRVKNGKLDVFATAGAVTSNANDFETYLVRCSLPWNYDPSDELYIDYIGLEAITSITGVNYEVYIQSIKLLHYKYKNCLTMDYFLIDRNNKGLLNAAPILPCGKNRLQLSYNGIDFDQYKLTGDDDVFIGYTYEISQYGTESRPQLFIQFMIVAISRKPFSISVYRKTPFNGMQRETIASVYNETFMDEQFFYIRPTSMYDWNITRSPYYIPDFSYIPDAPISNVAPIDGTASGVYYDIPRRMARYLITGQYYGDEDPEEEP